MSDRPQSGPLLQAARLYKNVSAKSGAVWFGGRWGPLKVVILENKSHNPDDPLQNHHYNLFLTEAPPAQPRPVNGTHLPLPAKPPVAPGETLPWDDTKASSQKSRPVARKRAAGGGPRTQLVDDEIPWMQP